MSFPTVDEKLALLQFGRPFVTALPESDDILSAFDKWHLLSVYLVEAQPSETPTTGWTLSWHERLWEIPEMTEFAECHTSEELICKHVRDVMTAYVDLDAFLPEAVTIVSATADTEAEDLDVSVAVIEDDTVISSYPACSERTLLAGRAVGVTLSGGVASEDEVIVTVCWTQSDGDTYCRDLRLLVGGRAAP